MHYLKPSKCSSFWTWVFFCKRQFGGTAVLLRLFGWDSYGDSRFGYKK